MSKKNLVDYLLLIPLIGLVIFLGNNIYKDINSIKINSYKKVLKQYTISKEVNDVWLIARVINREVTGCSIYDKIAVASSILNRVDDVAYDSTIYEVIYQRRQYAISDTFTNEDVKVAYAVYNGIIRDCNIKYFFNPKIANKKQMAIIRSTGTLKFKTDCHEYY